MGELFGKTERRCIMPRSREDLQLYGRACEHFLSADLEPTLTQEQQNFIIYYANELLNKFDPMRQVSTSYS